MYLISILIIVVIACISVKSRKPKTVTTYKPAPLSPAEVAKMQREHEKRQKALYQAEIAKNDIDRLECEKITLEKLLEAIETELQTATKPQRITTLLTKQSTTERQIHNLDRKIERAYYTANAVIY